MIKMDKNLARHKTENDQTNQPKTINNNNDWHNFCPFILSSLLRNTVLPKPTKCHLAKEETLLPRPPYNCELLACSFHKIYLTSTSFIKSINHDIYPGSSTPREVVFRQVLHPDRIGIWKCRSTRRKTSRSRVENQQQTQPTYDVESGNRTRVTLVGGECFHHCPNPAPLKFQFAKV